MSKSDTLATIIAVTIVVGLFSGAISLYLFGYPELTKHDLVVTIKEEQIVPSGNVGDGSYYIFNVNGTDRTVIETQRAWYMWGDNIDELYFSLKNLKGKTVELSCFGWYIPAWYWYDQCYKLNQVLE